VRIGSYETFAELGRGGMGVVYSARAADGRSVAIKVLGAAGAGAVERFAREMRLLASLGEAEGFIPLLDSGTHAGRLFLVMPLLEGGTLGAKLARGPLPLAEAVSLAVSLAKALGKAHERGIVHRDLKPENILLGRDGRAYVADLGLAKHWRTDVPGASVGDALSVAGSFAGTPGYMAPEQLDDAREAGPAADVFALGVILYEALAGERPFGGEGILGYTSALVKTLPPPLRARRPEVPRRLERAIERALARRPAERFPDGHALARALEAGLAGRASRLALGVAVVAVLGIALGVAALARPSPGSGPRLPATPSAPAPAVVAPATALIEDGLAKLRAGDADGAAALFLRATEVDPRSARAWLNLGVVLERRGDHEGAIRTTTKALELDPRFQLAWRNRGAMKTAAGDRAGAIADLDRAIELDPRDGRSYRCRGLARQGSDVPAAIGDFSRAIELDPKDVSAALSRIDLEIEGHDFGAVVTHAALGLEVEPGNELLLEKLGLGREMLGDLTGAVAAYTQAIEAGPREAIPWYYRSRAKAKQDDKDGAIADLERYLVLAPDGPYAQHARELLADVRRR
jgi:tetratricopeptide (TPR) repeat protein